MSFALQSLRTAGSPSYAAAHASVGERRDAGDGTRGSERSGEARVPTGRNALLGALTTALDELAGAPASGASPIRSDEPSASDRDARQALHAFVQGLFSALRPTEAEERQGRGFAWGRTSSADLARRIDALVQKLRGDAATPLPAPVGETTTEPPSEPSARPAAGATEPGAPAVPATDVTGQTEKPAVDAPLLSVFRELLAARSAGATTDEGAVDAGDALVALLQRISQALTGQDGGESPAAGSLLDVTA